MLVTLVKADTKIIRKALGFKEGRVYSEKRSYGRRVKFWCANMPLTVQESTKLLKEAFGDRFISINDCSSRVAQFEVCLKPFTTV